MNWLPEAAVVALLVNPTNSTTAEALPRKICVLVAQSLGLQLHVLNASRERDIDAAFATLGRMRVCERSRLLPTKDCCTGYSLVDLPHSRSAI